jgi:hypothetical protein
LFQRLNSESVNFVTLAATAGLVFAAFKLSMQPAETLTTGKLLGAAICLILFAAIFNYWRLLKITEAPTSTIAAAAQGYIELRGTASTAKPFKTPYHGLPCVWYRAWVYANQTDPETRESDHRLLNYSESDQLFQLQDDSGSCMVNPKGAEVIYVQKRTFYKNDHRYVEEYLPADKPLYLLGYLDTLHHYNSPAAIDKDTGDLLISWKKNPVKLINRFDQNRNGQIDMDEWEIARAEARKEVEARHQMHANTEMYTLAKPPKGQLFLISALSPQALRRKYQCWSLSHLAVIVVLMLTYFKIA